MPERITCFLSLALLIRHCQAYMEKYTKWTGTQVMFFRRNVRCQFGLWIRIRIGGSVSFWTSRIRIHHYLYESKSFRHTAKIVRKTLIFTVLWLFMTFYDLLSLKNDVNASSQCINQKNLEKNYFLLTPWRSLSKRAGSGSVPKCHRSTTLVSTNIIWNNIKIKGAVHKAKVVQCSSSRQLTSKVCIFH